MLTGEWTIPLLGQVLQDVEQTARTTVIINQLPHLTSTYFMEYVVLSISCAFLKLFYLYKNPMGLVLSSTTCHKWGFCCSKKFTCKKSNRTAGSSTEVSCRTRTLRQMSFQQGLLWRTLLISLCVCAHTGSIHTHTYTPQHVWEPNRIAPLRNTSWL